MLVVSVSAYDQLLCAQPPAVPSKLIQCPGLGKHIIIVRLSVTYTALTCGDNTTTKCDWTDLDGNDLLYRLVASKCNNKKSCVVDSSELYGMKSAYTACGTGDWTERDTVRVYYDCTSDVVTTLSATVVVTTPSTITTLSTSTLSITREITATMKPATGSTAKNPETNQSLGTAADKLSTVEIILIVLCVLLFVLYVVVIVAIGLWRRSANKLKMNIAFRDGMMTY